MEKGSIERSPAKKAIAKRKHIIAGQKGWEKVANNQWNKNKVDYLKSRKEEAKTDACVVCGDNRNKVLHDHHLDREKTIVVKLCANCHDLVRRGSLEDLFKAQRFGPLPEPMIYFAKGL